MPTTSFTAQDIKQAKALYHANPTPIAQQFLDLLIDNPDERFDSEEIQRRFAIEDHADIARTTYQLGEAASGMNKSRPWNEAQRGFTMDAATASLFRDARESN